MLGEDGFIEGHEEKARELRESVNFDGQGWPISSATGVLLTEAELVAMPAAVQLECRARLEVGEVPVFVIGEKCEVTHVHGDMTT